mmetsp:Transcript_991/g.1748  ORF Transcript_991/g.1748 Transcript_991/m.1748 type:complete len:220 (+) Transcript_991:3956-4615(+)
MVSLIVPQSKLKVKVHFIIGNKKNKISKDNRVISHNRPRGTLVKKALASVTNIEYRQFILEKVLPAIEEKWPRNHQRIRIQHDNAKPHIRNDDPQFQEAIRRSTFDIQLTSQPANSPDLNVLDLGFFNSIQSLQHQSAPRTVDELITIVQDSFQQLHHSTLNNTFLTLQTCMEECILHNGNNNYKIRHMSKQRLEREGRLPISIDCNPAVLQRVTRQDN